MTDARDIPAALVDALRDARHVCILTGAGVSAESGVPTFRDAQQGLWAEYDPLQLATVEGFMADPQTVWRWYAWRRDTVAGVEPNPGHVAIAELEALVPRVTLVTQNVDGLHQRAGSSAVVEFHGNIFVNRCIAENRALADVGEGEPPACPDCGAPVRPGVVWFGEMIPEDALNVSFAAAEDCDVFLSVGTSSEVYPAAGLADIAKQQGATTVEVNPVPTVQAERFDFALAGKSGEILPQLVKSLTAT
ncbi:MAG: NAD-dependent deacylase [Woeseiaceae bacterium]|nr:NAD-dependent deacylase [Woeseiaceae bacterium]